MPVAKSINRRLSPLFAEASRVFALADSWVIPRRVDGAVYALPERRFAFYAMVADLRGILEHQNYVLPLPAFAQLR
jgi:hypothetical protein